MIWMPLKTINHHNITPKTMTDTTAIQSAEHLETIIQYSFHNKALLQNALSHSSAGKEKSYERLEFLGDRVLGLVVAEILYKKFPNEPEGDLAKRLASLVQGEWLAKIANDINLGDYIDFSEAERNAGGHENAHILADVVEAVIGAMYLDTGLEPCKQFIESFWGDSFYSKKKPPQHPKTLLQEWLQGKGLPLPSYKIVRQDGPDHAPLFDIELIVKGYPPVIAQGRSRQDAEKAAAKAFMDSVLS